MVEYIKAIVAINIVKFKQEVIDSSIVPVMDSAVHNSADNSLYIYFNISLSAGEETTLDGLITAHDPTVIPLTPLEEFDIGSSIMDGSRSNAQLSISESPMIFNALMADNDDFLNIAAFAHSYAGYVMPQNGRIVKISGRAARQGTGTKYIDVWVDEVETQATLTFTTAAVESQYTITADIPFLAGERLRAKVRMPAGAKMYNLNVILWIRWEI